MPFDDTRSSVWELAVRSGTVDVLRTQLGSVDRNLYWFIGQFRLNRVLIFALGDAVHAMDVLSRACSSMEHKTSEEVQVHRRYGSLNDTAETQFTRVPAALKILAAITPRLGLAWADCKDSEVPWRPHTVRLTWSHSDQCVVFELAVTHLFDGKSASLSFCLVQTWCIQVAATIIAKKGLLTAEKSGTARFSNCA